ncbi:Histidine kinase [Hyella patelloides LEGE 07179]|uniref:histidine kinase n=1 Tax=Hyella patelloides LEGE 07179 TaxID=945734 RepID=A0A563VXT8_9CYAN|nr:HAMP domain-containing sensor histidine kinase [Hyella patelloides]VEP16239.1 Histidine kinase [Hyella patelloides LEGE 07179]
MNEIETLKEELKQTQLAYQMAVQMSQFKADFLARTSHELRSPLSSLIGLHQLILSDLCESPEEQKEFIAQAYNSAMKLMNLIDEIVAVSKTEYGTNKLNMESLQLASIFPEIYNLTHLQAANRNLRLKIIPPDYYIYVYADRVRLIQSITNLIDSGIAIMKEGNINLAAISVENTDKVTIKISFDCSAQLWQQESDIENKVIPNDLEQARELVQNINLSPKMRLLLSRTLLETMRGSLQLLDTSVENQNQNTTQIILTCKKPES